MDHGSEVQEFLRTRRARLTPEKANLIAGSNRRVPGLRREEVALLAGVSVDYAFRTRWAAHNVRFHRTGVKRLHHPVVGDLELSYEGLDLPADPGWHLFTFTATSGSPSDDQLRLLASWAATLEQENTSHSSADADVSENC
jgi:hypothetical protein